MVVVNHLWLGAKRKEIVIMAQLINPNEEQPLAALLETSVPALKGPPPNLSPVVVRSARKICCMARCGASAASW